MKNTNLKFLFVSLSVMFAINEGFSQVVTDSTGSKLENVGSDYRWTEPVLQSVNVDSIMKQKNDYASYLKSIEVLEVRLDNNRKELKMLTNQANDEAKVISNERKYLNEKKRFAKDEEKLLKTEKRLRDQEVRYLMTERKELKKNSKGLENADRKERVARLDEKDSKIKDLESKWNEKRSGLKTDLNVIAEKESKLDRREIEVKNRLRELDRMKETLALKEKQLNLEKKKTKQLLKTLNQP